MLRGYFEEMRLKYFADGEIHTIQDFKKLAIELNIIDENDKSSIRNTLYKIRNYPNVNVLERGKYIISAQEKTCSDNDITVEKAFIFLSDRLKEIKNMDVMMLCRYWIGAFEKPSDRFCVFEEICYNISNIFFEALVKRKVKIINIL